MASDGSIETPQTDSHATPPSTKDRPVAGFWKRLLALAIDILILCLFGLALGLVVGEPLVQLGAWGRLVGFMIAVAYLGTMNSRVFGGKTVGKMILRLRVVGSNGHPISLLRSMARSAILVAPAFINKLLVSVTGDNAPLLAVVGFLLFGLGGSIPYLYVFNRKTRQSLHDLAAGTYVVKAQSQGPVSLAPVSRIHYAVVGLLFLVSLSVSVDSSLLAPRMGPFADMYRAVERLNRAEGMQTVSVIRGQAFGGQKPVTFVRVEVWSSRQLTEELVTEVGNIVLDSYPDAAAVDYLDVRVVRGYDIGIATASKAMTMRLPPDQWKTPNTK